MNIVRITNLIQPGGRADYKGLDLDRIIAGSQLYPNDENTAYLFYDGDVAPDGDISIVSQSVYDGVVSKIQAELDKFVSPEQRINELEKAQGELLMEIAMLKTGGSL